MTDLQGLKSTPLLDNHKELGAKLAPFGGWLMPIQYSGIIDEHNWTRKSAGIFDICHMGEFIIEADLTKGNLNELVTVNLQAMSVGSCRYGFMLNEQGGVIDDLLVYRTGSAAWLLVVNAATTAADEVHLYKHLSGAARFENISTALGKLDLQGPEAAAVLRKLAGPGIDTLQYYTFAYFTLLGEKIIISRTGYTGELGYELYMPVEKIRELWKTILTDQRVRPIGLGARDTLRLEMGYGLYGQDIDTDTSPLEAGYSRFIDWDKEFIGKPALLKQKQNNHYRRMIYFVADSRRSPRHNYRILHHGEDLGSVTSGSFSPSLGVGIGMGYVARPIALGEEITLKEAAISISAKVVDRPFYKHGSIKQEN
jgi:aminomethyltransferase